MFVYILKTKSDAVQATGNALTDIAPNGEVHSGNCRIHKLGLPNIFATFGSCCFCKVLSTLTLSTILLEKLWNGKVFFEFCPTEKMLADVMTKPAPKLKLKRFAQDMFGT